MYASVGYSLIVTSIENPHVGSANFSESSVIFVSSILNEVSNR